MPRGSRRRAHRRQPHARAARRPRRSATGATSRANAPPDVSRARRTPTPLPLDLVARPPVTWARQHQVARTRVAPRRRPLPPHRGGPRHGTHRRARARCGPAHIGPRAPRTHPGPSGAARPLGPHRRSRAARVPPAGRRRTAGSAALPTPRTLATRRAMEGAVSHAASARTSSHRASRTSPPWIRHPAGRSSSRSWPCPKSSRTIDEHPEPGTEPREPPFARGLERAQQVGQAVPSPRSHRERDRSATPHRTRGSEVRRLVPAFVEVLTDRPIVLRSPRPSRPAGTGRRTARHANGAGTSTARPSARRPPRPIVSASDSTRRPRSGSRPRKR